MIRNYKNQGTEDIAKGLNSSAARSVLPVELHPHARRRLLALQAAGSIEDLRSIRGNRYHRLERARRGQHSIAVNNQYRICFEWVDTDAKNVEIVDYH